MKGSSSFDDCRVNSLVFTFTEELSKHYCGPEPDFSKWLDQAWYMDEGIAGDEAGNAESNPVKPSQTKSDQIKSNEKPAEPGPPTPVGLHPIAKNHAAA